MRSKRNRCIFVFLIFLFQTSYLFSLVRNDSPHFVIIIPSYNNKNWYKRNLDSVLSQRYKRYRVIYLDDCSSDGTGTFVQQYIAAHDVDNKITLIKNTQRKGALANLYCAIHSCDDNEIVVTLDGDDCFAHEHVLSILARAYRDPEIWLTYGQYIDLWGGLGCCREIDYHVIRQNLYRKKPNAASHLRTFYAWLFKAIKLEDMLYRGAFFSMTWDWAMMYPMLEMSGGRFKFIPNILYIYNTDNPLNDSKINEPLQGHLGKLIQQKKPYQPLTEPVIAEPDKTASCSLIVIVNNDTFHVQQAIDQLPTKQQCTISSVYILYKNHQEKATINQIFLENDMTEFVIVVTQDHLASLWARLDDAISLLRQTQASVCTFIETENVQINEIKQCKEREEKMEKSKDILQQKLDKSKKRMGFETSHCSPLSASVYTYQLGWKPEIFTKYWEQGYIFSLKFLREHAEQLLDLLNDDYKLRKNFKRVFPHCAGLLVELINNKENDENKWPEQA